MKDIRWTYVIACLCWIYGVIGIILNYATHGQAGHDWNTGAMDVVIGFGLFRARKATDRVEEKVNDIQCP